MSARKPTTRRAPAVEAKKAAEREARVTKRKLDAEQNGAASDAPAEIPEGLQPPGVAVLQVPVVGEDGQPEPGRWQPMIQMLNGADITQADTLLRLGRKALNEQLGLAD